MDALQEQPRPSPDETRAAGDRPPESAPRLAPAEMRPDPGETLDPRWVVSLLRVALALAALATFGVIVQCLWSGSPQARATVPSYFVVLAILVTASVFSLRSGFARHWRLATLAFCLFLVAVDTRAYVMTGEQVLMFVVILVFMTASCALVPWEFEWQVMLTAGLLVAAAVDTALVRPESVYIVQLWLAALTSSVMALAGNRLWARWRNALAETNCRLAASESRQRKLLDAQRDSVTLIRLSDGRYLYVNEAFLKRGYTREQVLGKSIVELGVHQDPYLKDLAARIRSEGVVPEHEVTLRMPDGRWVPHLLSMVLLEMDGELCVLSVTRDISESKRVQNDLILAQQRAEQNEARMRKIFEACPDTICINSLRDGRFIDINPRFDQTGYSREEVMNQPAGTLQMWAKPAQFMEFAQELVTRGIVHNREADFRLKDGTVRQGLISGAVIELDGEPCAVTFSSDISRLKRTEQELIAAREAALAASRAKSEFLSSMSHEIRTPMNAILGMADLLAETQLSAEQRRFVATMTGNGNALLSLINGILDLAKIESGRLNLEESEFDLEDLIEHVAETLGMRAHEKKLELTARILPDVPLRLVGDTLRLRQVLINLVGNAIKFTEQGEVALTVAREAAADGAIQLHFSVRDTGIGIAPDMLEAIFQSFTQADSSTTRRYGGSGLGLTIASRLVELMGGRIWASSEAGRGSTFHFVARLRVADGQAAAPERLPYLEAVRVLVVDDNATNRLIVREVLAAQGAEVSEAASGHEALLDAERARAEGHPYRIVLLDCRMPQMDGFQVARQLKRLPGGPPPIILMLSSEDLNQTLATVRELGIDLYIVKPVRRIELLRAIAAAMGRHPSDAKPPQPPSADRAGTNGSRALKILLAEDSPDNRQLIQAYLRNHPYELDFAENGQVAVTKFMRTGYDLILMDVRMPVMDGYTAVRKIRRWESQHGRAPTPIAALTASALEEDVRNSVEAGCTAHLGKPIKKSRLLDAIRDLTELPNRIGRRRRSQDRGRDRPRAGRTDPGLPGPQARGRVRADRRARTGRLPDAARDRP